MKNYLSRAREWLLQEKYQGRTNSQYFNDLERIKKGEPLDYIIGFKKFLDCHIDLSQKPFIPREETEYWTEKAIEIIKKENTKNNLKILDIFAGSGCIGISILKHIPQSKVVFADKYTRSIKQIKLNIKLNKISPSRYRVIQSDVFDNIKGKFDYIFANPPYISKEKAYRVKESVLQWEPQNALWGGKDGLFYIKKLLQQASNYLKAQGKIFLEFDDYQKKAIEKIIKQLNYSFYVFHKDQFKRWRWMEVIK